MEWILLAINMSLIVGSFLTMLTYRLPFMMRQGSKLRLFHPRSHCPECRHPLSLQDNIPILSYFLLKGSCRHCRAKIPIRYPLIEAMSVLLSIALIIRFGPSWTLVGALCFMWSLITLTTIDFHHFLLPDSLTLPLLWLGLAFNLFEIFTPLSSAVLGAMLGYVLLWSTAYLFTFFTDKKGMGHGDFKLFAAIGAWLGYADLPIILLISTLVAILIRLTYFSDKKEAYFAFGPYLCLGALIMLFC